MNTPSKNDKEGIATLEILNAISAQSDITQRNLADRLGVALGLANAYLKRCVKKGYVKIKQAPANRYLYYVTPQGFSEKSRLTAQYLSYSFDFYRTASAQIFATLEACRERGMRRVVFVGASELAEIACIRLLDLELDFVGTLDPANQAVTFLNRPLWRELGDVPQCDAYVFTALESCTGIYAELTNACGKDRIFVPPMVQPLTID